MLERLPVSKELLEIEKHEKSWDEKQKESRREFRAHIRVRFNGDGGEPHHEQYTLLHNPIFITLPPCQPGQNGAHKRHVSRLRTIEMPVKRLKEYPKSASMDETLVINALEKVQRWLRERGAHRSEDMQSCEKLTDLAWLVLSEARAALHRLLALSSGSRKSGLG
ncbi:hypothetical protein BJX65DRAFT_311081 [Aspergillus insuetus]